MNRDEDRAYRIERGRQKALQEARTEAAIQRTLMKVTLVAIAAYFFVIYLLIRGLLLGKSKCARIFSALGLLVIAIGTTVAVRYVMGDHAPKTPMSQYLEMDEQSFRAQCSSFLDPAAIGPIAPNVRTNLTAVLLFRDILRPMGISDESFKESYDAGGFEGLFQDDVMKRVASPDYFLYNIYSMSELKTALDKCLYQIDAPYWKQQEMKIRACLYFYIKEDGGDLCAAIIKSLNGDGNSKEVAMRALEAKEIVRVLRTLGMMGRIERKLNREQPSSSKDCVSRIVDRCGCRGVVEKWMLELGKWCIAWSLPDNVPNNITCLASPGFPYEGLARCSADQSIVSADPFVLVHMDGEIVTFRNVSLNDHCTLRKIFNDREDLGDLKQLKYLTPRGILMPFGTWQDEAREAIERKIDNAEARSMKTEAPILQTTNSESKADEIIEVPAELPPAVSSRLQIESKPQTGVSFEKNPHYEAAKKHDWSQKCKEEWKKSFHAIQKVFSVFGGFVLAQPPIDGIEFKTEGIQEDVPLQKEYRYFKKADLKFYSGALVGFTLKAHFAKSYSRASIDREYKAFQDDVVKNLKRLHRPEFGVTVGTMPPWTVRYGELPSPSVHNLTGEVLTLTSMRQDEGGFDLTLSVEAGRDLKYFIDLALKEEADGTGVELEVFDKKQQSNGEGAFRNDASHASAVSPTNVVRITGYGSYRFGQKYAAARMTAEMWQEGGLAIKPVQVYYRKFRTLELGYAIDGKRLCRMRFCAEFQPDADENQLNGELTGIKAELERQYGFKMTQIGNEFRYEDENYVVKVWRQSVAKTVYNTRHVGARRQRIARTVNVKGIYLLLEDKRLMP